MNFLGREKAESIITDHGGAIPEGATAHVAVGQEGSLTEHAKGVGSSSEQRDKTGDVSEAAEKRLGSNTYAGLVIFCVPIAAETDRGDIDLSTLQVWEWRMAMLNFIMGECNVHV
jgi:hypothetical protein